MTSGSSTLEIFQLNKNSTEQDLEQCILWLREVFRDRFPKTISVVVKRLGNNDPLNSSNLQRTTQAVGMNSSANVLMMNNSLAQNESNQFNKQLLREDKANENLQNASQSREFNSQKQPIREEEHNPGDQNISDNSQLSDHSSLNFSRVVDENDALGLSEKARQLYLNQKFQEALELYHKSQQIVSANDDKQNLKLGFQNKIYIGSIYAQIRDRKRAILELSEALDMSANLDVSEIAQENEQSKKENQQKYINSNPLYFINLTLGNLYHEEKDYEKAISHLESAFKQIEKSTNVVERKSQALVLNTLGMIYYTQNQIPISIQKFQDSLAIFRDLLQLPECQNDPVLIFSYANRLNNLGEAYRRNKQIEQSIEKFKESLSMKEEAQLQSKDITIETEKSIASTHNNLGMSYFSLKQIDDAIVHLTIAAEKYQKIVEKGEAQDKLGYANILNQRGDCYRVKHEFPASTEDFKLSYKLKVEVLGEQNKSTLMTLNNYAQLLFGTKNLAKSKQAFMDLLRIQKKVFGDQDNQVAQTLNNLGTVLSENQEYEQAEEMIKEAIAIYSNSRGNEQNLERVQRNLSAIQARRQSKIQSQQQ